MLLSQIIFFNSSLRRREMRTSRQLGRLLVGVCFLGLFALGCPDVDAEACRNQEDCLEGFYCWESDLICHTDPEEVGFFFEDGGYVIPLEDGGFTPSPDPTPSPEPEPEPIPDVPIDDFTVGSMGVCAKDELGGTFCYGANSAGQLTGDPDDWQDFSAIPGVSDVEDIALGTRFSCFIGKFGGVFGAYCMGEGYSDNSGVPASELEGYAPHLLEFSDPLFVPEEIVVSDRQGGCARGGGDVYCWGPGLSSSLDLPAYPTLIPSLNSASRLFAGATFLCADVLGEIYCVRPGDLVTLGCEAENLSRCSALDDVDSFSASIRNACKVVNQEVWCAGENSYGVVFPENPSGSSFTERKIDLPPAKSVVVHNQGACSLGVDGKVRCWGRNLWNWNGQGPDEIGGPCEFESAKCHEPLEVDGVDGATELRGTYGFSCAFAAGRSLRCWGQSSGAQSFGPSRLVVP
ncbi:MAG: hypothetical protein GY822_32005 [Deltaproteobacteria bacterium]|nr:hypothetical protein [Deltaproteobacteria bacterium]